MKALWNYYNTFVVVLLDCKTKTLQSPSTESHAIHVLKPITIEMKYILLKNIPFS